LAKSEISGIVFFLIEHDVARSPRVASEERDAHLRRFAHNLKRELSGSIEVGRF
jgi:hypothetical protein